MKIAGQKLQVTIRASKAHSPAGIAAAIDRFFARPGHFRREEIARRAQRYSWPHQCAAIKHLYP